MLAGTFQIKVCNGGNHSERLNPESFSTFVCYFHWNLWFWMFLLSSFSTLYFSNHVSANQRLHRWSWQTGCLDCALVDAVLKALLENKLCCTKAAISEGFIDLLVCVQAAAIVWKVASSLSARSTFEPSSPQLCLQTSRVWSTNVIHECNFHTNSEQQVRKVSFLNEWMLQNPAVMASFLQSSGWRTACPPSGTGWRKSIQRPFSFY